MLEAGCSRLDFRNAMTNDLITVVGGLVDPASWILHPTNEKGRPFGRPDSKSLKRLYFSATGRTSLLAPISAVAASVISR